MKKLSVVIVIIASSIIILGLRLTDSRILYSDSVSLEELYSEYKDTHLIAGFKVKSLGSLKIITPDKISKDKIKIVELEEDSEESIYYELLKYSKDFKYNISQPFPYLHELEKSGGNCQALSLWFSENLTHYGIKNDLYLSEGNDHMYNIVFLEGRTLKVDLSIREVQVINGNGI